MSIHTPITAADAKAPARILTGNELALMGVKTDPLNGARWLNIPGYGIVTAQVMTNPANRFGPESFEVWTHDSPAMIKRKSERFATRQAAQGWADAYLVRAYQQEVR